MEEKTYQVYATVGGSMEEICVFEGTGAECAEKCRLYEKNPRKLAHLTRNYLTGWGSGIDGVFMIPKA